LFVVEASVFPIFFENCFVGIGNIDIGLQYCHMTTKHLQINYFPEDNVIIHDVFKMFHMLLLEEVEL
jgi:hypothetical protein